MKIKICNKCQFRTLAENKICRTCGSREFTDFEVLNFPETVHMPKLDSNLFDQWKNMLSARWNSLLNILNSTPSELSQRSESATRRLRDLAPATKDEA